VVEWYQVLEGALGAALEVVSEVVLEVALAVGPLLAG